MPGRLAPPLGSLWLCRAILQLKLGISAGVKMVPAFKLGLKTDGSRGRAMFEKSKADYSACGMEPYRLVI